MTEIQRSYAKDELPNVGILKVQFTDADLAPLRTEIDQIRQNFDLGQPFNDQLAGNIEHEYLLTASHSHTEKLLGPLVAEHDKLYNSIGDSIKQLGTKKMVPVTLDKLWVNFQRKHEFNPLHDHSGVISFVIWLEVPYLMRDEQARPSSRRANVNIPGQFCLVSLNTLGKIQCTNFPVDREWRNRALIFPSSMHHCVYPFYTSDDYRISVSGNFVLGENHAHKARIPSAGLDSYLSAKRSGDI